MISGLDGVTGSYGLCKVIVVIQIYIGSLGSPTARLKLPKCSPFAYPDL